MIYPLNWDRPRTLGSFEATSFATLRDEIAAEGRGLRQNYVWEDDQNLRYPSLGPLQALVLDQCVDRSVESIEFDTDFGTVPDGGAQRLPYWHAGEEACATASTELFTDILVLDNTPLKERGLWTPELAAKQARRRALLGPYNLRALNRLRWQVLGEELCSPEKEAARLLRLYGLVIYNPKPSEVIALEGQIHRSPVNNTGQAITGRGWVRIRPRPARAKFRE